jgi:hypothetical protein
MSIKCLCGCKIEVKNLKNHLDSEKHDKKVIKKMAPSLDKIRELMVSVDNISDKLTEGDYLAKCNKLKIAYNYWKDEHEFKRIWVAYILLKKVVIQYYDHSGKSHTFDIPIN